MWYVEDIYDIEEEFLHPVLPYEIRFSTVKPKKEFILRVRTCLRLAAMSEKTLKNILQEWINETFETPYKVREILSVEIY